MTTTYTMYALLALILTGCAAEPLKVETQTIKLLPPQEFTQPTPVPELIGNTNQDLLFWAIDLESSLEKCNVDKVKILDWGKKQ